MAKNVQFSLFQSNKYFRCLLSEVKILHVWLNIRVSKRFYLSLHPKWIRIYETISTSMDACVQHDIRSWKRLWLGVVLLPKAIATVFQGRGRVLFLNIRDFVCSWRVRIFSISDITTVPFQPRSLILSSLLLNFSRYFCNHSETSCIL